MQLGGVKFADYPKIRISTYSELRQTTKPTKKGAENGRTF